LKEKGLARPIDIAVASLEDGRAMLAKMRLDGAHAQASFRASSPLRFVRGRVLWSAAAMIGLIMLLGFGLTHASPGIAAIVGTALLPLLIVGPILPFVWPTTVRVGSDGVAIEWLGRRKTIRFADVASFEASAVRVRLSLRGGAVVDVLADPAACAAIGERLRPLLEHHALDVEALERRGRPVGEWVASLHALARRAEGFRDVPLDEDRLWSVIEDPRASATAKAGAAVALAPKLDDTGRARLRVAREAVISPKLRVAFDAAEGRDADALHDALEDLDEERARA
jgi:hypothetical protein